MSDNELRERDQPDEATPDQGDQTRGETADETPWPIGANRAAERLRARLGLEVDRADIEELARHGLLAAAGEYKGWPLYDLGELDQLDRPALEPLIANRVAWQTSSLSRSDAARRLGWSVEEFEQAARTRGVAPGRFGRYATDQVEALAADEDLAAEIHGRRLLGPHQAAAHLEIRPVDFGYCVAAGWIRPAAYGESQVSRRRSVDVPLYRTADIEALREIPGVDWEAVRAAKPGEPSPLREFAARPTPRGTLVRGFAADLADTYGIQVTAAYDGNRDRWNLRWAPNDQGHPTPEAVAAAIHADRDLNPHARVIALHVQAAETKEPQRP